MTEQRKKEAFIGLLSKILAGFNGLALIISVGYSLYIRSRFLQVYDDLGASLPALTQLFVGTPAWIWMLFALLGLVILAVKELIPKKWIPLLLNGLFLLFGIIYWAVFSTAMVIPLMRVIEQVSAA